MTDHVTVVGAIGPTSTVDTMGDHFSLVIPPHTIRWYEKGEHCTDPQSGDIILVDHGTIASNLIEEIEKMATVRESDLKGYTWCGHTAIIRTDLGPTPIVSEMGFKGYERRELETYKARRYAVVNFDVVDAQRIAACAFDDSMKDADYGWVEYPAIVLDDVTGLQLDVSWSDHLICSAATMIVGSALGFMGSRLATRTEPMRIAMWLGAKYPYVLTSGATNNDALTAPIVQAHAQSRILHETVWTPTHPKRGSSSSEFKETKAALLKESPECYICGKTAETSGAPMELHHVHLEWSLANSGDIAKILKDFPQAGTIEQFLDSVDNGLILCAHCHRSPLRGVHMVTMPAWIAQKYQLDGWDLVNGPASSTARALAPDLSGYFPEH